MIAKSKSATLCPLLQISDNTVNVKFTISPFIFIKLVIIYQIDIGYAENRRGNCKHETRKKNTGTFENLLSLTIMSFELILN